MVPGEEEVQIDFNQLDELSMEILHKLSQHEINVIVGSAACVLSLGRLLAARELTQDEEAKFVQDMLNWGMMYWAEGEA